MFQQKGVMSQAALAIRASAVDELAYDLKDLAFPDNSDVLTE